MQQADAVVVGADAILDDGSVVNKCGTSLLAIAAQYFKVPFYVLADSSKHTKISSADFILEELPAKELGATKSPFIHPHNIYFDITPASLVMAYINEFGVQRSWPRANTSEELR
jgi:translation initiation factor eIF-2B subunit delta